MKKVVYRYLDEIFGKSEIRLADTEYGKVYRAVIGNNETLFRTQFQRRGRGLSIHFNHEEFKLIKNIFALEVEETIHFIRDYLGDKIDPNLYDLPFHPYL